MLLNFGVLGNASYNPMNHQPIVTNAQTVPVGIARLPSSLHPGTQLPASAPMGFNTHQNVVDNQEFNQNEPPGSSVTAWEDETNHYRSLQTSENEGIFFTLTIFFLTSVAFI